MFNPEDIGVANKTSRANGAVGSRAITPRYVREHLELFYDKETTTILDFGAGKAAAHARDLQADGWAVIAHEFGDNIDVRYHCELALMQKYDVVYASNVLNVQSGFGMIRASLFQVEEVLKQDGVFFANFPASPRKLQITVEQMEVMLLEHFSIVNRVGGTKSAPLWICTK